MKYRNRGGRVIDYLDPNDPETQAMLKKKEIFPIKSRGPKQTVKKSKVDDTPVQEAELPAKEETLEEPDPAPVADAEISVEKARKDYELKYGKPVPNAFKNKLDWIKSKL